MGVSSWVWPRERWRRRGFTPASRSWVAYACRRGWMATPIVVMPARRLAVRKAPWTLVRRMGEGAGGLCWCSRPVAGKSQVLFRWVFQWVRSRASGAAGRGTYRSLAPLPRWIWTWRRCPSMSETCRERAAWSRSPALEDVLREEANATGADTHGSWGKAIDVFAVQEGVLQLLCRDAVG